MTQPDSFFEAKLAQLEERDRVQKELGLVRAAELEREYQEYLLDPKAIADAERAGNSHWKQVGMNASLHGV
jgi:hypothetical protein